MQSGRWSALDLYIDRIEAHSRSDFSHAVENAKALLETIGKEICDAKGADLGKAPSINGVVVTQISGSLANLGQQSAICATRSAPPPMASRWTSCGSGTAP